MVAQERETNNFKYNLMVSDTGPTGHIIGSTNDMRHLRAIKEKRQPLGQDINSEWAKDLPLKLFFQNGNTMLVELKDVKAAPRLRQSEQRCGQW